MGGTWDATNLVTGDVAVITPIGLDHPELGSTITEVAGEKAGIVKDGQDRRRARAAPGRARRDRDPVRPGRRVDAARVPRLGGARASPGRGGPGIRDAGNATRPTTICILPLFGEHAVRNAAAAIVAVRAAPRRAARRRAAAGGARSRPPVARAPRGRVAPARDRARRRPQSGGGRGAGRGAARSRSPGSGCTWCCRSARTRTSWASSTRWPRLADAAYATRNAERASRRARHRSPSALRRARHAASRCTAPSTEALDAARDAASDADLICVTGSLYTVADARRALGVTT